MQSMFPLASSKETVHWFSWYNNLIYLKVSPTPCFNFYFPPIGNNKMADTHTFQAAATLALLTFRPQNDSSRLRMLYVSYCNVLLQCTVSLFLFTSKKHNFLWAKVSVKCQWMNMCVCVCVCVRERERDIHVTVHHTHLNMFQTSARATETFHVLPSIATQLFPYHMFGLPFPLNCFHSTSYVCIVCAFPGCVKIIPCNFNSTCLCSKTQLWPLLGVCSEKNGESEDICVHVWYVKLSVEWYI